MGRRVRGTEGWGAASARRRRGAARSGDALRQAASKRALAPQPPHPLVACPLLSPRRAAPRRHQKLLALSRPGGAYRSLLSPGDAAALPLLSRFQRLAAFRRQPRPPGALEGAALVDYYTRLIHKYVGAERLFW